jgi:glycosyltransferase involved in cell wall biosynthesis
VVRHEENLGFPSALNTLLAEARGAFVAFFDDDDASAPQRVRAQYDRLTAYEELHAGDPTLCYSNRRIVPSDPADAEFERLGIGRVAPEPSGPVVADFVLGLVKDDGEHCWGSFGSGTLLTRTETLRRHGGFDVRFRRNAELDLAVRAALGGAHFISADEVLMTQYLTPKPEKAGRVDLTYNVLLVRKHKTYLKARRAYAGAWCNAHARFHHERPWRRKLWSLAALVSFPWDVSRERLRHSSLVARLGLAPRLSSSHQPTAG